MKLYEIKTPHAFQNDTCIYRYALFTNDENAFFLEDLDYFGSFSWWMMIFFWPLTF